MGSLLGSVEVDCFHVADVCELPVEGTETRVNPQGDAYEYMVNHQLYLEQLGRTEKVVGWYHSHPGYGCWLSGIDVATQQLQQQFQDPFVAVVVDPLRSISSGSVDIGAFRTFEHFRHAGRLATSSVPDEKLQEFGAHADKYYSLKVNVVASQEDQHALLCFSDDIPRFSADIDYKREAEAMERIAAALKRWQAKISVGDAPAEIPELDSELSVVVAAVRNQSVLQAVKEALLSSQQ